MLVRLKHLQDEAGVTARASARGEVAEDEARFEEVAEVAEVAEPGDPSPSSDILTVEREQLTIPSSGNVDGNDLREIEICLRVKQAQRQINRLREIVADISFQYTHVIPEAVRKSPRTAAHKRIKALHNQRSFNARIYARCRNKLIALNCDQQVLRVFRVLTREDLHASSEIHSPNSLGSSKLKLSWIWQTGRWYLFRRDPDAEPDTEAANNPDQITDPATLLECSFAALLHYYSF